MWPRDDEIVTRDVADEPRGSEAPSRPGRGTFALVARPGSVGDGEDSIDPGRMPRGGETLRPVQSADKMHALLGERIAAIDRDHRSVWRKILGRVIRA
jgi:hypothetical protein